MKKVMELISSKGKMVVMPILMVFVLVSIFIFNGFLSVDTAIVTTNDGTFIYASGMVEKNAVTVSSELVGIIDEVSIKEGDKVTNGQIIAKINNTNLNNQYEQAIIAVQIAEKNIKAIEDNLTSFDSVSDNSIEQARNAYMAAEGEFEKVLEGATPEEIQQAEEAVNQAKVNLEFMEENLGKVQILLENDAISQAKFDEAKLNYNITLAQYNTAKSKLELIKSGPTNATIKAVENKMLQAKSGYELAIVNTDAQYVNLQNQLEIGKLQLEQSKMQAEQLKKELDKTIVKSPVDGIISLLNVKQGELTQLGKPVAQIYDPNNIEIKVYVSEANIGHVKVGQYVEISVDSEENEVFAGKVIKVNDNAEFTPKNIQTKEERVNTVFEVKIMAIDSQGVIKSGMPVDVNIKID